MVNIRSRRGNELELQITEHEGQRVLTTIQLAEAYGTDAKVINRNFQRNFDRYVPGKHFIALTGEDLRAFKGSRQIDVNLKYASVLYLWTRNGAFLAAKSLNTEKAWGAYEKLVDTYFELERQVKILSEKEQLEASMKLALMNSEDLATLKNDMKGIRSMVEEQITLHHGEQRRVQKAVASKVYELSSDKQARQSLFSELYSEIKDRFGVASYRDIKRNEMQIALRYIEAWIPKKVVS